MPRGFFILFAGHSVGMRDRYFIFRPVFRFSGRDGQCMTAVSGFSFCPGSVMTRMGRKVRRTMHGRRIRLFILPQKRHDTDVP